MSDDTIDFALLDKNVSDIEDLPSFDTPPKGTYVLLANAGTKKINDGNYVTVDFDVVSTIELANPNDPKNPAVKDGSKFNLLFQLGNEFGEGNMKKFMAPFVEHFGTDNLRSLVTEKIQNITISCNIDHRVDKKSDKVYPLVKNVVIQ